LINLGSSAQFWYLLGPEKGAKKDQAKVTGQLLLEFTYTEIVPPVRLRTEGVNNFLLFIFNILIGLRNAEIRKRCSVGDGHESQVEVGGSDQSKRR
jgi:hypothetical protein